MQKLIFLILTFGLAHAANEQTGPTGGAGAQILPGTKTSAEAWDDFETLNDYVAQSLMFSTTACQWSFFMGDLIVDCTAPLGVQAPADVEMDVKVSVLLKCSGKVIGSGLWSADFKRKSNALHVYGPAFDYDLVRVLSDKSYEEREKRGDWLSSTTCKASQFSAEMVPLSADVRRNIKGGRAGKVYTHNAVNSLSAMNGNFSKREEIIDHLIDGDAERLARYCTPGPLYRKLTCEQQSATGVKEYGKYGTHYMKKMQEKWEDKDREAFEACGRLLWKGKDCPQRESLVKTCTENPSDPKCTPAVQRFLKDWAGIGVRG